MATVKPREGEDYGTYRDDYPGRGPGVWRRYCLHCNDDSGRGTSLTRKDARDKARAHVTENHPEKLTGVASGAPSQ